MKRNKVFMALAAVLMMFAVSACKGGEKKPEEQEPSFHKYGYTVRKIATDPDSKQYDGDLLEEYENTGTKRTYTKYNVDGSVDYCEESEYDSKGEQLLRESCKDPDSVDYVSEYDSAGRLVMYSENYGEMWAGQNEAIAFGSSLTYPKEYFVNSPKTMLCAEGIENWAVEGILEDVDSVVTGLKTTYSYDEKTGKLRKAVTVTNRGDEVCSVTYGDGDIVLSERIRGAHYAYEEEFDAKTGGSEWQYYNDGTLMMHGANVYDDQNRCIRSVCYTANGQIQCELTIRYEETGYTIEYRDPKKLILPENTQMVRTYDTHDRMVREERYSRLEGGSDYLSRTYNFEYDGDGTKKRGLTVFMDEIGNIVYQSEVFYDSEGEITAQRETVNGKQRLGLKSELTEEAGVAGPVNRSVSVYYPDDGTGEVRQEVYMVQMTDEQDWNRKDWVSYRNRYLKGGRDTEELKAFFDDEGHLQRVEQYYENNAAPWNGQVREYDEKGRILRRFLTFPDGTQNGEAYEYWEDEKPGGDRK